MQASQLETRGAEEVQACLKEVQSGLAPGMPHLAHSAECQDYLLEVKTALRVLNLLQTKETRVGVRALAHAHPRLIGMTKVYHRDCSLIPLK